MGRAKEEVEGEPGVDRLEQTARELGKMMKESAEYTRFTQASEAFAEDEDLKKMLETLAKKEKAIEEKMQKGVPVEVEEKREVGELREKTREHPTYAEFVDAQSEYLALLKRVNDAVNEAAGAERENREG
jgi:cell fate (sporulation/competence/biofilm development) regulator YlbF (YheA/YmcA/DUF963 family)